MHRLENRRQPLEESVTQSRIHSRFRVRLNADEMETSRSTTYLAMTQEHVPLMLPEWATSEEFPIDRLQPHIIVVRINQCVHHAEDTKH